MFGSVHTGHVVTSLASATSPNFIFTNNVCCYCKVRLAEIFIFKRNFAHILRTSMVMSSSDNLSGGFGSSASNISLGLEETCSRASPSTVYNATHSIDIVYSTGLRTVKTVTITVLGQSSTVKIKVRDPSSEYAFNYTLVVDRNTFEQIKLEQSLDIAFDEFRPQLINMLKDVISKELLIRLDIDDLTCKLVFYERLPLKSLVFLTLDLATTNQKELIEEMSNGIAQLKDANCSLTSSLSNIKIRLRQAETLTKDAMNQKVQLEKQFRKDHDCVSKVVSECLVRLETSMSTELGKLFKRLEKVTGNVHAVKRNCLKKSENEQRLIKSLQNVKLESENSNRLIRDLKVEIEVLNVSKTRLEQNCSELQHTLSSKSVEIEALKNQNAELRRDNQDATMIIAQKTKTNDELGKDLVQANTMIVGFNGRYDALGREMGELKDRLRAAERLASERSNELIETRREFDAYRQNYNSDEFNRLHHEAFAARQRADELEKLNKEVTILNNLLTKKVSSTDMLHEHRNENRGFGSNSNNDWTSPRM